MNVNKPHHKGVGNKNALKQETDKKTAQITLRIERSRKEEWKAKAGARNMKLIDYLAYCVDLDKS